MILASLTSLPNAYTAAHLASRGRGAAVVSATVNSNTINLVVGLALPTVVFGMGRTAREVGVELGWLLGMTVIGLLLLLPARGMTRVGEPGRKRDFHVQWCGLQRMAHRKRSQFSRSGSHACKLTMRIVSDFATSFVLEVR